ncbi:MAG: transcriptional repressor LexA [Acidobacteria bacterium]|nr:transcriptional repressor LexA [Acidobacteriota bacterium]
MLPSPATVRAKGGHVTRTERTDLTARQRAILEFIERTRDERGYPPSVREIGEAVGLRSPSSVHSQLATLQARGHLRKDPTRPRAIRLTPESPEEPRRPFRNVPLLGRIAAGQPILAQEDLEDVLPIAEDLVGSGTLFALRVKGDSMIGAGIFDGDLVVIREQPAAENGDIVAALVEGEEATVKRLHRRGTRVLLEPANPAYEPIESPDVRVLGKVVSVLRRM